MKNFKLFLAFTAFSAVAMADAPVDTKAKDANPAETKVEASMLDKAIDYAKAPFVCVNDLGKSGDKAVVDFVAPYINKTTSFTSDVVSELVNSPVRLVAVAGACYAAYFAYEMHNAAANKKSKN